MTTNPEIENSPLSKKVKWGTGITLDVQIYRLASGDEGWSLEVIQQKKARPLFGTTVCDGRGCVFRSFSGQ